MTERMQPVYHHLTGMVIGQSRTNGLALLLFMRVTEGLHPSGAELKWALDVVSRSVQVTTRALRCLVDWHVVFDDSAAG